MSGRLKDFIARRVIHPLQGMTLGDWRALLRRHRHPIDRRHRPRAWFQAALAASNSIGARVERRAFGGRVGRAVVEAPLFVLGHYRGGTTHLHNLLALDPDRAAPTFYQVLNPHTFLTTEPLGAPLADRLVIPHRLQDDVALGANVPGEDELALGAMTGLSPYLGWYFPRERAEYDRTLTFAGVPADEVDRWGRALTTFLKKLTVRHGRPLVLKSPPHTARVGLLLHLFPDARFVHIHRHPGDVFRSTRHTARTVQPAFRLQEAPPIDDEAILGIYTAMYDAYLAQRALIPAGRLCEVAFDDLRRDPVGVVGTIYDALGLAGFGQWRPLLDGYLATVAGFRQNRHDDLPEPLRRRVAAEWGRSYAEWGYAP